MTDTDIKAKMTERWQHRSPIEQANQLAARQYGEEGNWDLPADVIPKRELLYLAVGIPDTASLPKSELRDATLQVYDEPGDAALRYGFGSGPAALRNWLALHRNHHEHSDVDENWFLMTNGSSGAIDLVVRSMIEPGDVIISESPTYMGTLSNFRGVGADIRYVPIDEDGMQTDKLDQLLTQLADEGKRVRLIYTISAFHNPTGVTLSLQRREALLDIAFRHDVMILDDEAYRELWYETPPPTALSTLSGGYGVITTGTFSKTIATGLRVGWIHADPQLLGLFIRMRYAMGQNGVAIRGVQNFLANGHYEPHLNKMRDIYRHKRDKLHKALLSEGVDQWLDWQAPNGGFYLWASLKNGLSAEALWRTAVEEGVAINSGKGFTPDPIHRQPCVRIAYAWTPVVQLPEAARRIRLACERISQGDVA
ncbi:MAG: PLP-dependent aminotransferase family protein [Pseudomonadales bacterium]|nr:PLP-dependent aminotransferase family protein [Pseudomonadales bacterium]